MIGTGGSAIVSKALGEGRRDLANQYFSMLVYVSAIGGVILAVTGMFLLRPIAILLGATGELVNLCVLYGRILMVSLTAFLLQNVFQSFFVTALSNGIVSTTISFLRTLVFQVAVVLTLPIVLGIDGIWLAVAAAELLTLTVTIWFLINRRNQYHYA